MYKLILGRQPGSRSELQAHNRGWHSDHKKIQKTFIGKKFRVAISSHTICDPVLLQEFALSKYWFIVDLCWLQDDLNQKFKWSPPTQFYNHRNVSIKLISRLRPLLILAWKFYEFYLFFSRSVRSPHQYLTLCCKAARFRPTFRIEKINCSHQLKQRISNIEINLSCAGWNKLG